MNYYAAKQKKYKQKQLNHLKGLLLNNTLINMLA